MSGDWYKDIVDLYTAWEFPVALHPTVPLAQNVRLQIRLIREETKELIRAMTAGNEEAIADGVADSIVVILGVVALYGIDIRPIWDEVQRSNMAKVGGPIRADGKRLKPQGWKPPDIAKLIKAQKRRRK